MKKKCVVIKWSLWIKVCELNNGVIALIYGFEEYLVICLLVIIDECDIAVANLTMKSALKKEY